MDHVTRKIYPDKMSVLCNMKKKTLCDMCALRDMGVL